MYSAGLRDETRIQDVPTRQDGHSSAIFIFLFLFVCMLALW